MPATRWFRKMINLTEQETEVLNILISELKSEKNVLDFFIRKAKGPIFRRLLIYRKKCYDNVLNCAREQDIEGIAAWQDKHSVVNEIINTKYVVSEVLEDEEL